MYKYILIITENIFPFSAFSNFDRIFERQYSKKMLSSLIHFFNHVNHVFTTLYWKSIYIE